MFYNPEKTSVCMVLIFLRVDTLGWFVCGSGTLSILWLQFENLPLTLLTSNHTIWTPAPVAPELKFATLLSWLPITVPSTDIIILVGAGSMTTVQVKIAFWVLLKLKLKSLSLKWFVHMARGACDEMGSPTLKRNKINMGVYLYQELYMNITLCKPFIIKIRPQKYYLQPKVW